MLLCAMMLPWDSRALEDLLFIKAKHRTHPLLPTDSTVAHAWGKTKSTSDEPHVSQSSEMFPAEPLGDRL